MGEVDPALIRGCLGGVKVCNHCRIEKPETEFKPYKKRGAYTRWYVCMACEAIDWRSPERRKQAAEALRQRTKTNIQIRQRQKVTAKLRYAVKTGKIIRPTICDRCGQEPPPLRNGNPCVEAHHHDYSKPYDVRWLCKPCHAIEHKEEADAKPEDVVQPPAVAADIAERLKAYSGHQYQRALLNRGSHDTIITELLADAAAAGAEIERLRSLVSKTKSHQAGDHQ